MVPANKLSDVLSACRRIEAAPGSIFMLAWAGLPSGWLTCSPVKLPLDVPGAVYHQFAIEYPDRDNLKSYLAQKGIGTGVHYPLGVHQQAAYLTTGLSLPVTEGLASTLLSLPIQPEVAGPNIETICAALQEGIERCAR